MRLNWKIVGLLAISLSYTGMIACKSNSSSDDGADEMEEVCKEVARVCPDGSQALRPAGSVSYRGEEVKSCQLVCPGEPGYPIKTSTSTSTSTQTTTAVVTHHATTTFTNVGTNTSTSTR